jgi:threonine dehydratase
MAEISLQDIRAAAARIAGSIARTPFDHSRTLSRLTGVDIWLKFENLQFTASFKERGALNKLLSLDAAQRIRGVIAMSAGNHAQGVAFHAARLGVRAVIVMPRGTPNSKVRGTQVHGAEVVIEGDTLADASLHAHKLAERDGLTFIHPYDDPLVVAGQGTVALEMLEQQPALDALVVPVGGGGLISGMAIAAKALQPEIEVIGVESTLWCAMHQRLAGLPVAVGGDTIAEGLAVRDVGELTLRIARESWSTRSCLSRRKRSSRRSCSWSRSRRRSPRAPAPPASPRCCSTLPASPAGASASRSAAATSTRGCSPTC